MHAPLTSYVDLLIRTGQVERCTLDRDERTVTIGFVVFATTLAVLSIAYLIGAVLMVPWLP